MLAQAQFTVIPDTHFEQFLINEGIDDILDGQVLTANITSITSLQINESPPNFPIEDLTGIEDFISLELLYINFTNLTNVDFGNLVNLLDLQCSLFNNDLSNIDISGCLNLEELSISDTNISSIDISQNLNLIQINASNTNLNILDVSQHSNLTTLTVFNSSLLTELNFRNGNNENITFFGSSGSPNLQCILVDDANYSTINWTNVDPTTTFVETQEQCDALSVDNFTLNTFKIYPNPTNDFFKINSNKEITEISIFDISGKKIKRFNQSIESYDVSDLSNGVYFLTIKSDKRTVTKKLIINNTE